MAEAKGKPNYSRPNAAREGSRGPDGLGPLQVRYYGRMRPHHVYGVVVTCPKRDERPAPAGAAPLTLRLLMAGAQVVPTELVLDPTDPNAKATFYVTPLAKGWLRSERLEILAGGRKVQEVALPAKVSGQTLTWILLLLAVLVPWFLLSYGKYSPLTWTAKDLAESKQLKKLDKNPGAQKNILLAPDPLKAAMSRIPDGRFDVGELLAERLNRELPTFLTDNDIAQDALSKIGAVYDNLVYWQTEDRHPIAFYVFAGLLVLAILSFIVSQDRRKKKWSKPIPLPRGVGDGAAARREGAVAAELE